MNKVASLHTATGNLDYSVQLIQLLLKAGANVNMKDEDCYNRTPIHTVEQKEAAEALIKAGADLITRDDRQWSPLHSASMLSDSKVFFTILNELKDEKTRDEALHIPNTTLLHCVLSGSCPSLAVIEFCHSRNLSLLSYNSAGLNPLYADTSSSSNREHYSFLLYDESIDHLIKVFGKTQVGDALNQPHPRDGLTLIHTAQINTLSKLAEFGNSLFSIYYFVFF